jgi:galactokinase
MKTSFLEEFGLMFYISIDGCWVRGACVALIAAGRAEAIAQDVIERYKRSGYAGRILVPEVS